MSRNKQIGLNLKNLRLKAGITSQAALADLCGWSQSRIGNYESGARSLSPKVAAVIARHLHVTADQIIFPESGYESEVKLEHKASSQTNMKPNQFYDEQVLVGALNQSDELNPASIELEPKELRFPKATLEYLKVNAETSAFIVIEGNAMGPVLPEGAVVAFDQSMVNIKDGKMFAINQDGIIRIRLCYRTPGGYRMRSYNQSEYPDEVIAFDDETTNVVGKVFWWSVLAL